MKLKDSGILSKEKRTALDSVKDALNGLKFIINNEKNFVREILCATIVLILSLVFKLSNIEFIVIIITIALVFISEIFNTAIEKMVDLYTKDYNEIAKIAKDVSALAVFIMCMFSFVIGCIIFIPRIFNLIGEL